MSVWFKVFHLIAVVHYYFGLTYYVTQVADHEQIHRKYKFGGIFVHLTLLNFVSCLKFIFDWIHVKVVSRSSIHFTSQLHLSTTSLGRTLFRRRTDH